MERLSYYDVIADLLPGVVFLWALSYLGPWEQLSADMILTNNVVVDSILVVSLSFVAGHLLQFISRYSIEPIIKRIWWRGSFFSDIFLIKEFSHCPDSERRRFIMMAQDRLGFDADDLMTLDDTEVQEDTTKRNKAADVARAIYRAVDAKTKDAGTAAKAHKQNASYTLFRSLSAASFTIASLSAVSIFIPSLFANPRPMWVVLVEIAIGTVFLVRAKQRGELYVKGLFWSYS